MSTKRFLSLLSALTFLACSADDPPATTDSTGSNASAANDSDVTATCDAICSKDTRCATANEPASSDCMSNCGADFSKPEVYRADALAALSACFGELGCDTTDDSCTEQAILAAVSNPTADPRYTSCRSRFESCNVSAPGSFSDDICSWRLILTNAVQAPLDDCLALDCDAVSDCIDGLLEPRP